MLKAKLVPTLVDVYCPHCKEPQTDSKWFESTMWEVDMMKEGQKFECDDCGRGFEIPKYIPRTRIGS